MRPDRNDITIVRDDGWLWPWIVMVRGYPVEVFWTRWGAERLAEKIWARVQARP